MNESFLQVSSTWTWINFAKTNFHLIDKLCLLNAFANNFQSFWHFGPYHVVLSVVLTAYRYVFLYLKHLRRLVNGSPSWLFHGHVQGQNSIHIGIFEVWHRFHYSHIGRGQKINYDSCLPHVRRWSCDSDQPVGPCCYYKLDSLVPRCMLTTELGDLPNFSTYSPCSWRLARMWTLRVECTTDFLSNHWISLF
jgi:hypothetical protein